MAEQKAVNDLLRLSSLDENPEEPDVRIMQTPVLKKKRPQPRLSHQRSKSFKKLNVPNAQSQTIVRRQSVSTQRQRYQPVVKEPVVIEPIVKEPILKERIVKTPIVKSPVVKEPIVKQLVPTPKSHPRRVHSQPKAQRIFTPLLNLHQMITPATNSVITEQVSPKYTRISRNRFENKENFRKSHSREISIRAILPRPQAEYRNFNRLSIGDHVSKSFIL